MKTTLLQEIEKLGLSKREVSESTGIKYNTVHCHLEGIRKISPLFAIVYERGLGISRQTLRPDIFGDLPTPSAPEVPQEAVNEP
jgi:DNA-binding transcriptional regulator YdaS (Cro superfamily)